MLELNACSPKSTIPEKKNYKSKFHNTADFNKILIQPKKKKPTLRADSLVLCEPTGLTSSNEWTMATASNSPSCQKEKFLSYET